MNVVLNRTAGKFPRDRHSRGAFVSQVVTVSSYTAFVYRHAFLFVPGGLSLRRVLCVFLAFVSAKDVIFGNLLGVL